MSITEHDIYAVKKVNLYIRRLILYIKQIRFISISGVEYFNKALKSTE